MGVGRASAGDGHAISGIGQVSAGVGHASAGVGHAISDVGHAISCNTKWNFNDLLKLNVKTLFKGNLNMSFKSCLK
jgi:hypothetical protein